ncbi:HOLIN TRANSMEMBRANE MEMBRANE PROPHAGE FAMILY BHLB SPP1 5'REGION HOLIN ORF050 [Anaerobutyricum hallii]|uniref:HOLIN TRANSMEMBRANE MEMBRANE PROPHAGE FAMILY BHLB SPP1 5'REGION HOLIN ORF050 n=1 Tax=Anaerobutyricum hallii TaxID=39488 RepID=A0A285PRS2_9FIRM|nr:phage holin [Anaerobutyricum hallii]SOB72339.1 HOLIN TRANSMEMBRANE MEMBRANE PROPHAGE FAMILY BHLB SPP1 5'REGION HOLIN ORF050 [Anaerobutyricum hallii]
MNKVKNFLEQINVKDIKASTYVSAVVLIFTMVNYVLNIMGKPVININENEIAAWVTAIVGVVGIIYSWYKNQSITHPAQVADDIMKILKDGRITISELEDFIARYSETDLDTEADFDDIEKVPEDDVDDEIDEGSDE